MKKKTNLPQRESIERRSFPFTAHREASDEDGKLKLSGHAAVFNRETVLVPRDAWFKGSPEIREVILPGAFTKTLKEGDARALWNHNTDIVLGRMGNDTLELRQDDIGLANDIFPPDTQLVRDMCIAPIERGDVDQMSFGFIPTRETRIEDEDSILFEIREVKLIEVSPCTIPAYPQTDIGLSARSMDRLEDIRQQRQAAIQPPAPGQAAHPEQGLDQSATPGQDIHPDESRAMKMMEPMFKVGDRVKITVVPHMEGHDVGEIAEMNRGPAYGIKFDGMDEEIHRWYTHSELEPEEMSEDESAPDDMRHLDDDLDLRLELAVRQHRRIAA